MNLRGLPPFTDNLISAIEMTAMRAQGAGGQDVKTSCIIRPINNERKI
jgi:hypothetical protein